MGTKGLLALAIGAAAAVALLGRDAPATARTARAATDTETPGDIRVEAPPEAPPRPRVVGTDGTVAGARLAFHAWGAEEPVATAETDGAGSFDLPGERAWAVVVRADGYPPKAFELEDDLKELRLDPGAIRRLAIADEDGNPGAHAEVLVYGDYALSLLLSRAEADGRGVATLWLGGSERILVKLAGYACEEAQGADRLVLRRGFTIAGRVVDGAGVPVPGASVHLSQGGG